MTKFQNNDLFFLIKKIKWPKSLFIIAVFTVSLGSVSELIVPLLTGKFIDMLVTESIQYRFLLILGALFILDALLNGIGLFLLMKVGGKIIYLLRSFLWSHIIYLNVPFFDKNENGELISRLTEDTSLINNFISQKIPTVIPGLLTLCGSLFMLFIIDWKMTLLTFITIPIFILVVMPLSNIVENISQSTQLEIAKFTGILGRVLSAIRLVKVSNTESVEIAQAEEKLNNIYKLNIKHAKIMAVLEPFSSILLLIMIGIILGFGGYRIAVGAISSGQLVTMIFYVIQLSSPINTLSTFITDYKNAKGASKRITQILQEEKENFALSSCKSKTLETLVFNNVYFSYDDTYVLKNISFTVPKGSTIAIVGPSGSGKTTLFNILTRMYSIDFGTITCGKHSIYDFSLSEWRNRIGYVMQNNSIMSGTIKSNILYGTNRAISQDEIDKYARLSNSYDFIMNLSGNYNFEVGDAGGKLSGGQKQRINITRNLIKNPDLLLLDEATASLDSESERQVQHALEYLSHNRTTLIIAHRLSTIKNADKILFLDEGKITGQGSHDELIHTHDKYYKFVTNQNLK